MRTTSLVLASFAGLVLLMGCDLITGPDDRMLSIIEPGPGPRENATSPEDCAFLDFYCPALEAPDSVNAGVPFEIIVRTLTNIEGCHGPAGERVSASRSAVEVTVYDRRSENCIDTSRRTSRTVGLTFEEAGDVLIRVTGRMYDGDGYRAASIDHRVVVVR